MSYKSDLIKMLRNCMLACALEYIENLDNELDIIKLERTKAILSTYEYIIDMIDIEEELDEELDDKKLEEQFNNLLNADKRECQYLLNFLDMDEDFRKRNFDGFGKRAISRNT